MSCKFCRMKELKDGTIRGWKFFEYGYKGTDDRWIQPSEKDGFEMVVLYDSGYSATTVVGLKYCPFCGDRLQIRKENK